MAEPGRRVRIRLSDGTTGTMTVGDAKSFVSDTPSPPRRGSNPFHTLDRAKTNVESALSKAETIGSYDPENEYGTIKARPSFMESALPATGQIVGGGVGAKVGGAPGMVLGATAGAVAGKGGQLALRARRQEPMTPGKVMGELGVEGAVTGAVETAFPLAGRALKPIVGPQMAMAKKFISKKVARPLVENIGRFFTGIPADNTERLLARGPRILRREMRSRERGTRIAERFLGNADEGLKKINQDWADTVTPLTADPANVIKGDGVLAALKNVANSFLHDPEPAIPGVRDVFDEVRKTMKGIASFAVKQKWTPGIVPRVKGQRGIPQLVGRDIPLWRALGARQQLDDLIETGGKQGLITARQKAAMSELREAFRASIHETYPDIAKVDKERELIGRGLQVIEKFDAEAVNSVGKLAKMVDRFESIDPAVREALQEADEAVKRATGRSMLATIKDRSAAVAFEPAEIRATRTWLVTAALGAMGLAGWATAGGPGAAASTALGIGLSMPRALGHFIIPGSIAAGRAAKKGTVAFTRRAAPVTAAQVFRKPPPEDQP